MSSKLADIGDHGVDESKDHSANAKYKRRVVRDYLRGTGMQETLSDAVHTMISGPYLVPNPFPYLADAVRHEEILIAVGVTKHRTASETKAAVAELTNEVVVAHADAGLWATKQSEDQFFGYEHVMKVVDVKGLQYVTNLLSSHPGLYLDVKQVEGKYKVRVLTAITGSCLSHGRLIPYLSEIHLNHEFIVSGPRFEKAVGVFARYLFKQAVDTTQSGTAVFYGIAIAPPARHAAFDGPKKMWTLSMMQASIKRFSSDLKAAIVARRRIAFIADYAMFDAVKVHRFMPVKRVYSFHYSSTSSKRSFAQYPGECLLVGVFVDLQSALVYDSLLDDISPTSEAAQPLRFSLKMDVASALAVGQYDIAMWNLVLVLSWAGRVDLLPCIQAFHKTRAHALSFLAQSCATVARVMSLIRDANVMAAAAATGEADIKGSTLKDKIAWSKAVIQQQFSLFKRQAWQMLGLASVRGTSMTVGSEDADQVTLAIADQARADEAAAAAAAAATGAPVAAGAGAGSDDSNAFTPSGVSSDEAETATVWSFDLENVYKSPSDASGFRGKLRWLFTLCCDPVSRMLLDDPSVPGRLGTITRIIRSIALAQAETYLPLCASLFPGETGEGAKVSLTDIGVVLQQQVQGAAKGKARLPWLSVPPLPRDDKILALDVADEVKRAEATHKFPSTISEESVRLQYAIDSRLDVALTDIYTKFYHASTLHASPYPTVVHQLQSWAMRHYMHPDTDEHFLRDFRDSRHRVHDFRTHTYVSRESNGAEIYGTAAAVYIAQPTVVWNIALAIAPAFHRPTVQAEAAYSVVVSQSIVLNARLLGWTGAGAPPEIEMMEHVLIEGPSIEVGMQTFIEYIIEAVEDFTEGSSSNNLHAFSGASPAVQRQGPARGGAGAGAGAGAGGGRRTSGEERRDFRSHVVLGLRIGSQWESVYKPPPFSSVVPGGQKIVQEGRYSSPSKPSRGYLDSDVEQDGNALRYSLHRNLDQLPPAHVQAASRVKHGRSSTPPFRSLEYRTYSDADLETRRGRKVVTMRLMEAIRNRTPIELQLLIDTGTGYSLVHKHFTFTFEDLPGHGLHEFAFPRAQAPYLQVFLDSSEATAELGIVTTVEDPMKSTSSMYINCVDATRRYIAWSAARGEVFEAYQQLALLAQIRGDAVLLAPCLRMVRCIVGRLSQLSSATAVVRLFVQHVSASEALMSKVGRQRLVDQLEDFRKQLEALCADAQWVCLKPLHTPLRVYVAHALRIASHMPFADNAPDVVPADESTYEPSDARVPESQAFGLSAFSARFGGAEGGIGTSAAALVNVIAEINAMLETVACSIAHKVLSHDVHVARVIRQLAKEHVPRGFLQV